MIGARRTRHPYAENLTVIRPAGTDDYGDPLPAASHVLPDCVIAPATGAENVERRDTVTYAVDVWAGTGADIEATDQVARADGTRWHVVGPPQPWTSPVSGRGGVQFRLERVTG